VNCEGLAIVLDGGGARAAYQVGLLRALARHYPDLNIPIITGVSAGAINAVFLANHSGTLAEAVDDLTRLWLDLKVDDVYRVDSPSLLSNIAHWSTRLIGGGKRLKPPERGLLDTTPLQNTLSRVLNVGENGEITNISRNIESGRLDALAIIASSYTTGRSVAWVQGRRNLHDWERPFRHSKKATITLNHVMASSALPILFPAWRLDSAWYGDGGIRLTAPLSPALHLGANRILAISTRFGRKQDEDGGEVQVRDYPPPAQIAGQLLSAIFIDDHDRDALALSRINWLARELPPERRHGLRVVDLVLIRPSVNIGRLAGDYEPRLPGLFRYLTRGLGSRATSTPDMLSLLMFDPGYLRRLIEIGEADAELRAADIAELLLGPSASVP
jgi:NTE family protein